MPLVINTNVQSLNSQRQLVKSGADMSKAMERLSSGMRINKAADDAAGLAIANRMTSQVRGLNQAVRNANDGVSMVQTAEGGLNEITNMLQRMRELAVQSANGIYSDADRATLNAESEQLKSEIQRIADTTSFNGQALLDGSLGNVLLQVGSEANQTIGVNIAEVNNEKLGVSAKAGLSSFAQTGLATALNGLGTGDLIINGVAIGSADSSADTASTASATSSAISIASAINAKSDLSGVTATVEQSTLGGAAMPGAGALDTTLSINGIALGTLDRAANSTDEEARAATVTLINNYSAQTGVKAMDSGTSEGGVVLVAEDGRNIALTAGTAASMAGFGLTFGGADGETEITTGTVALRSTSGGDITITSDATGDASDGGFTVGKYSGVQAQVATQLEDSTTALSAGDVVINGVSIGASQASSDTASSVNKDASAISKAAAINKVSEQTGVTAVVLENFVKGTSQTATAAADAMDININGINITATMTGVLSDDRELIVNAINDKSGQTGVYAVDSGEDAGGVQLFAADGRNIDVADNASTDATLADYGLAVATNIGEFTLVSDKSIEVSSGTGTIANSGLTAGTYGNAEDGQSIANVDISTAAGAQSAIKGLDNAIDNINAIRADLGAVSNRLDFATSNLMNVSENTAAARSRIQDADFAAETAALSRAQVLQQASTAMLAQANAQPQQVLSLLQ
ncbi:flagellin [Simiduia curdlanivorans]|uniref:Flagellin n=1 Tax=Simiduia curdlanivorans TaxID=1492769 RepID=A0ABV8V7E1_9GAMM|nr:flagellin [Simiduia curdlanivorans]MDN3639843.1 flagellin [Simiduia curdlanivorans]